MEVLCAHRPGLPLVDLQVVLRAGVELDPPELAGLATLTGEMIEEGTLTRTSFEIAEHMDRLGASLSVRAGWDQTTISLHTLSTRFEEALSLTGDVIRNATFPEAEFRRRRDERLASLLQERDEPTALAARALMAAVYGAGHPYGRSARGTRATVARLERDTLVAFHDRQYRPGNAFLVVAGDVGADAATVAIESAFNGWSGNTAVVQPPAEVVRPAGMSIHLVDRPGAPQSEIRIGTAGPPRRTPDYAAAVVANTVLGGSFTSRLNLRLREEKGYTYGARSSFAFRRGPGPFAAGAAVFTDVTAAAIVDAVHEIRRLNEEPVGEDELERARSYWILGLPRRLETAAAMAVQLAELHLHDLPSSTILETAERVRAVTAADVQQVARAHLDPATMSVVVVGDAARVRGALEAIELGPVLDDDVEI